MREIIIVISECISKSECIKLEKLQKKSKLFIVLKLGTLGLKIVKSKERSV